MARPNKYDADDLANKLEIYIEEEANPIIAGFCIRPGSPCRDTLYELAKNNKRLSDTIKKAIQKQEVFYENGAALGVVNPTFAIFKLKQPAHGWTDKQQNDVNMSGGLEIKWAGDE